MDVNRCATGCLDEIRDIVGVKPPGKRGIDLREFRSFTLFGVIRPAWDVEGGVNAIHDDGHCFYSTHDGHRYPCRRTWEGIQTAMEDGDLIGMLLDLDQGSMTVWKNDVRLGVMQAEGLSGPLCWAVVLGYSDTSGRLEPDGRRNWRQRGRDSTRTIRRWVQALAVNKLFCVFQMDFILISKIRFVYFMTACGTLVRTLDTLATHPHASHQTLCWTH